MLLSAGSATAAGVGFPIPVVAATCSDNAGCGVGECCFNFGCQVGSCGGACKALVSTGQCGDCVNAYEGLQDGCPAGNWCALGICGNCQPAGASCAVSPCCAGIPCDQPPSGANYCVTCDANHVQTVPNEVAAPGSGGNKCEASCGASALCDEKAAKTSVPPGRCNAQCTYKDGDPSPADCSIATSDLVPATLNRWSMGGEVSPAACCGDDAGENSWYKKCKSGGVCDSLTDTACCDAPTDCVYNDNCYSAFTESIKFLYDENIDFCTGKNEVPCTNGESKIRCQWTGSSCVVAATKAAVQLSFKTGNLSAYTDINGDGKQEVCVAGSPGEWESASGSVIGFVRNVSTVNAAGACPVGGCPVSGAVVRVLGTGLPPVTTAADGFYTIASVPSGNWDVVAAKTDYDAKTAYGFFVPDGATVNADFVLVRALGNCEDDCTTPGSNLCDASCHGKGLCWFYSSETRQACDGTFGIVDLSGGRQVSCCEDQPYSPIKADVTVRAKEVIKIIKPVVYKGKLVKLVTLLFIPER